MRVTIIALGTQGSVQPHIALGLGLQAAGHEVCLLTNEDFIELAQNAGLKNCVTVFGSVQYWMNRDKAYHKEKKESLLAGAWRWRSLAQPFVTEFLRVCWEAACEWKTEALISSWTGYSVGEPIAQKLGIPHIPALVQPLHHTREFPNMFWPSAPRWLGKGQDYYNLASHRISERILRLFGEGLLNRAQAAVLDLPPTRHTRRTMTLYGISPALMPKPHDWKENVYVTGFWPLERASAWEPPADLVDFLNAGEPPVYVGFGSVSARDPERTTHIVVEALKRVRCRALLATGWGGLVPGELPDNMFQIKEAPHDWLFPRMAALVHHGGPGTTAVGLRAGVPTQVIPFITDQFLFGKLIERRQVGPAPILQKRLTIDNLAANIKRMMTDRTMRENARSLGEQAHNEDGVRRAVELFEEHIVARRDVKISA